MARTNRTGSGICVGQAGVERFKPERSRTEPRLQRTFNTAPRTCSLAAVACSRLPKLSSWGLRSGSVRRLNSRVTRTLTSVGFIVGVNVRLGGEPGWVTCIIDRIRPLIHPNPVDGHSYWERQVFEINKTEVRGHSQVNNEVLWDKFSVH